MKIFALNLCIEFDVLEPSSGMESTALSVDKWRATWEQTSPSELAPCHILATHSDDVVDIIWNLQSHESWRHLESKVRFLFQDKKHRKKTWKKLKKRFKKKLAAGGLVKNEQGDILGIFNRGHWTFPKGHAEKGESIEETAIREVQEETGLNRLHIIQALPTTWHSFQGKNKWKLKKTHWYLMESSITETLIPQSEEYIEAVEWISLSTWNKRKHLMYPQNRWTLQQAKLPDSPFSR